MKRTLSTIILILFSLSSFSQVPVEIESPYIFYNDGNHYVKSIVEDSLNNIAYYSGRFTNVGYDYERLALLYPSLDSINHSFPKPADFQPNINSVTDVVAIHNGWVLGGSFNSIKGVQTQYLAFIDSVGQVHPMEFSVNGPVSKLVHKDSVLAIVGSFSSINGQIAGGLALVNTYTNEVYENTPSFSQAISGGSAMGNTIEDVAIEDDEVFVAGGFRRAGNVSWHGGSIDIQTETFSQIRSADGVHCAIGDGEGGWFIGGRFEQVGDSVRKRLAHLNSEGFLTNFRFDCDSTVEHIELHNDTLYLSGKFTSVAGQERKRFAAIDISQNELTSINPSINFTVTDFAVQSDSICLTGQFFSVGEPYEEITRVDFSTAALSQSTPVPNGPVHHIIPDGIGGWFIFGDFSQVGGIQRLSAAHINADGALSSWQIGSNVVFNDTPQSICLEQGKLYLAGSFEVLGSQENLIAVSALSGELSLAASQVQGTINKLTTDSESIFIGGDYQLDGVSTYISRLDIQAESIEPFVNQPEGEVTALCITGDRIFVSGSFENLAQGEDQQHITSYSISSLAPMLTSISLNYNATDMVSDAGTLYLVGYFNEVNGIERNEVAAIDLANSQLTFWQPEIHSAYAESRIEIYNNQVYLSKIRIDEPSERFLLRFDMQYGMLDEGWTPDFYSTGALAIQDGGILAGTSSDLGVENRPYALSINKQGELLQWAPSYNKPFKHLAYGDDYLYAISTDPNDYADTLIRFGSDGIKDNWGAFVTENFKNLRVSNGLVYLGGLFYNEEENDLQSIKTYDIENDQFTSTDFFDGYDPFVSTFEIRNDTLFVTTTQPNENGSMLSLKNAITGEDLGWEGSVEAVPFASISIIALSGNNVYVDYPFTGGEERNRLASFNLYTGELSDLTHPSGPPNIDGINNLLIKGDTLCYTTDGFQESFIVSEISTGNLIWSRSLLSDQQVIVGDSLIISGNFSEIDGTPRNSLASIKLSNGELLPWNPLEQESIIFETIHLDSSLVFKVWPNGEGLKYMTLDLNSGELIEGLLNPFGVEFAENQTPADDIQKNQYGSLLFGDFDVVDTKSRKGLLSRNTITGDITEWNPIQGDWDTNWDRIESMVIHGDSIYVAGDFSSINGVERNSFASIHRFTGELGNWNPNFTNPPIQVSKLNGNLFIRGTIGSAFGEERNKGVLINLEDYSLLPFNPDVEIFDFDNLGDTIYFGGSFNTVQGQARDGLAAMIISTNQLIEWEPSGQVTQSIYEPRIQVNDTLVFVREYYNLENGQSANGINAFKTSNSEWVEWSENSVCYPWSDFLLKDDKLYVSNYDQDDFNALRIIDVTTGDLSGWDEHKTFSGALSSDANLLFHGTAIYEFQDCGLNIDCIDADLLLEGDTLMINPQVLLQDISNDCGTLEFTSSVEFLDCSQLGQSSIEITAINTLGQSASCTSQVNLVDIQGPSIECNDLQLQLNLDDEDELTESLILESGDFGACEISEIQILGQTNFDCQDIGESFLIDVEAFDLSGNMATCSSLIEIVLSDDDLDGIDNSCDLCFGDNSSGDSDGDGICDDSEIVGCLYPGASNFNPFATDPGLCSFLPNQPPDELTAAVTEDGDGLAGIHSETTTGYSSMQDWMVSVYPNPINGSVINIYVQDLDPIGHGAIVTLRDVNGRELFKRNYSNIGNSSQVLLSLEFDRELDKGIYFLVVEIDGLAKAKKVLK